MRHDPRLRIWGLDCPSSMGGFHAGPNISTTSQGARETATPDDALSLNTSGLNDCGAVHRRDGPHSHDHGHDPDDGDDDHHHHRGHACHSDHGVCPVCRVSAGYPAYRACRDRSAWQVAPEGLQESTCPVQRRAGWAENRSKRRATAAQVLPVAGLPECALVFPYHCLLGLTRLPRARTP